VGPILYSAGLGAHANQKSNGMARSLLGLRSPRVSISPQQWSIPAANRVANEFVGSN
jgi:hypothetical protein